ncbi:helix-turn-helix transcriptional regulator [Streptomyces sp. NPDC051684]|uniref:helix-turn-helix transcriptional regulator n=1 Tax=Streptomyces sp. NPDC051684 TaxID=3365670 RepID=UPI00379F7BDF
MTPDGLPPQHAAPRHTSFSSTDPDAVRTFLDCAYELNVRMTTPRSGRAFRHSRTDAGTFAVDDVDTPLDLNVAARMDSLLIVGVRRGTFAHQCAGFDERFAVGDVFIQALPDRTYRSSTHDAALQAVLLRPSLLHEAAGQLPGEPLGAWQFTGLRPSSPQLAELWKSTVRHIAHHVLANDEAAGQPLLIGNASRLLAATALTVFPNDALPPAPPRRASAPVPATVRRAMSFIDDHAHRDIGLADIAAAAHVTPRALQYAFRRHQDTTPLAYLRVARLANAHRDLLAADPDSTTVAAIAARWGFLHPGRFTAQYRSQYGHSPSTALRQ